jgi:hypothetical protein
VDRSRSRIWPPPRGKRTSSTTFREYSFLEIPCEPVSLKYFLELKPRALGWNLKA